jgi:hypothetical protein
MDTGAIIKELEAERTRLDQAITALRGRKRGGGRPTGSTNGLKLERGPIIRIAPPRVACQFYLRKT